MATDLLLEFKVEVQHLDPARSGMGSDTFMAASVCEFKVGMQCLRYP